MVEFNMVVDRKHLQEAIDSCADEVQKALFMCGLVAEQTAKDKLTLQNARDTGNLINSISFQVESDGNVDKMTVGTVVHYAQYVEYGTGAENVPGGTPKPSWVYKGEDGQWHRGYPQEPRPFIKPAIENNKDKFKQIIEQELKNAKVD